MFGAEKNLTEVVVKELPACQLDHFLAPPPDAEYDARLKGQTTWAFMCAGCFQLYGAGLGLGLGQKLIRQATDEELRARGLLG